MDASRASEASSQVFAAMPLSQWVDTKDTLHRFAQIVGKVRMAQSPPRNHWWNVPFHLTGRGITTGRWASRRCTRSTSTFSTTGW